MDRSRSMTTIEYTAYRRIRADVTLNHSQTTEHEKKALNRLVKKGLVLEIEGGWTVDANAAP
jgi:hypothetical protein